MNHENIVKIETHFFQDGFLYIVMEYAEGGDLKQIISQKKEKNEKITEEFIWNLAE